MPKEICEPFKSICVAADPEEVDFLDLKVINSLVMPIPVKIKFSFQKQTHSRCQKLENLFKIREGLCKEFTYQTDFKIEAKGVTPIPAPMHIITSYLKTS